MKTKALKKDAEYFREFTFCNSENIEVMVCIDNHGTIIDMYCYKDSPPYFENTNTGNETKAATKHNRINPLFATIVNKKATLAKMVAHGDYVPLLESNDKDYETDFNILIKCFTKYNITRHDNAFQ